MNHLKLSLATNYQSKPANIRIVCCGKIIYDDNLVKGLQIDRIIDKFDQFKLEIFKSGKTKDIVAKEHKQEVVIENVNLNGIDLKIAEFGRFALKDNPYVEEELLQTNRLHLNGVWSLELPQRDLVGEIKIDQLELRDKIDDCDIACFGCSQTYGVYLEYQDSWPARMAEITKKSVKNFGIPGSNINEMISFVDYYLGKHKAKIVLLFLPHTFRRQMYIDTEFKNISAPNIANKELIIHGEEHSISVLAGDLYDWLENVSRSVKIMIGTYVESEYRMFEKTQLKKFMIPFLDGANYPKASDGQHHGTEYNKDFAKMLVNFLNFD